MYLLDADWWPQKNAIERTLAVLEANPKLAYVQTQRVSYHGAMTNWEKCLALSEDGCYYADLPGRAAVGDMVLFTGCCTLFRLSAVNRVGGFHPGHLTEDIDLSNRLYLAGYKAAYLEDVANEGEVPPHYHSYRRQQERWTMGTARTFKEYIIPIFKSSKLTFREKSSMFRQNAYYTGSVAVELSIILAFITTVFLSTASHTIEASTFEYYFGIIGFPYALVMFIMLLSNFAAPAVVAIKRRSLIHLIYAPFATWLSWSLLHTYFIGNIKGLFNIKRDWAVTPKGMRKRVKHFASHAQHVRFINFVTLVLLLIVYSIEWVQFGIIDPFAFFWIPALTTGVFFS